MKIAILDDYQNFCRTTEACQKLAGHEVVVNDVRREAAEPPRTVLPQRAMEDPRHPLRLPRHGAQSADDHCHARRRPRHGRDGRRDAADAGRGGTPALAELTSHRIARG